MDAEKVTERIAHHGEGPVWDPERSRLLIVDMLQGDVLDLGDPRRTRPTSDTVRRHHVGVIAAALRSRAAGGFVVATEHGFSLFDADFVLERELPDVLTDGGIRMNDGGCDLQGRFYCGTMAYDERHGAGTLYRLEPDGVTSVALEDATISNGLQWSADGRTAYYIDTPTQCIDAFDYDGETGEFSNRRHVAVVDPSQGHPDGMAIDSEGGLWVALWGGGKVHHYHPDGRLADVITVPGVTNTSAVAFGGPELDVLYITTSREDIADGAEPSAGAVFAVSPGVRGRVLPGYAG
ncbi:SMP-30/gluconolactonase/LRE family protein [Rathayibacter sp. CAU 1779]